jgi:hypothetical protein
MAGLSWFTRVQDVGISPMVESIAESVISKGLQEVMSQSRIIEMGEISKNWEFYEGNQERHLTRYPDEEVAEFNAKYKPAFNYTQLVVSQYIMGVFGQDPNVMINVPEAQAWWDLQTIENPMFNRLSYFRMAQQISELSNSCVIIPKWDEYNKTITLEQIKGERVEIYPDDENPGQMGLVVISYMYDRGYETKDAGRFWRRIELYCKELIQVWNVDIERKLAYLDYDEPNPYIDDRGRQIIPVTVLTPMPDPDSFMGSSGIDQTVKINDAFNQLWMDLIHMVKYQSFSILVVDSGELGSESDETKIIVSPRHYISGTGVKASYAIPAADIDGCLKVIESIKKELLDLSRLPVFMLAGSGGGSAESGISLRIKRLPTTQLWEERQGVYGQQYVDLVRKSFVVGNAHTGRKFPVNKLGISIDWGRPEEIMSAEEEMRATLWRMNHGLVTAVDLMTQENPSMSREQAKEAIFNNLKEQAELRAQRTELSPEMQAELAQQLNKLKGGIPNA